MESEDYKTSKETNTGRWKEIILQICEGTHRFFDYCREGGPQLHHFINTSDLTASKGPQSLFTPIQQQTW